MDERTLQDQVAPGANPTLTYDEATSEAQSLERRYQIGLVVAGVGGAALLTGIAGMLLNSGDPSEEPKMTLLPGRGGLTWTARW